MFFTLVFGGTPYDAAKAPYPTPFPTYHLVFHPWPMWSVYRSYGSVQKTLLGDKTYADLGSALRTHASSFFNPGPVADDDWSQHDRAGYRIGYLQPLLQREGLSSGANPNVAVCVQSAGHHGTKEDLQRLISDLQNHKFEITIVRMDE